MSRAFEATTRLTYFQQQELVWEIFSSPECRQETHWLEWKEALDLREKEAQAKIAKAILGFANRSPATAGRYAGGYAYLLVGVQPASLAGVERVDAAALEDGIGRYVSRQVPWGIDYVEVDEREVLVIHVGPPNWGDPVHAVQKSYGSRPFNFAEGDIYIRRQASTDQADAQDINMLSERSARGQRDRGPLSPIETSQRQDEFRVAVRFSPRILLLDRLDLSTAAQDEFIHGRELNRAPLPVAHRSDLAGPSGARIREDAAPPRTVSPTIPEQDAPQRDDMVELRRRLLPALVEGAMARDIGALSITLENPSDITFVGVELELNVPPGCGIFLRRDVLSMLPQSPRRDQQTQLFRSVGSGHDSRVSPGRMSAKGGRRRSRAEIEKYVFDPVTVRAGRSVSLAKVHIVAVASMESGLHRLQWSATATNAPKRVNGGCDIVIAESVWTPRQLLAA